MGKQQGVEEGHKHPHANDAQHDCQSSVADAHYLGLRDSLLVRLSRLDLLHLFFQGGVYEGHAVFPESYAVALYGVFQGLLLQLESFRFEASYLFLLP